MDPRKIELGPTGNPGLGSVDSGPGTPPAVTGPTQSEQAGGTTIGNTTENPSTGFLDAVLGSASAAGAFWKTWGVSDGLLVLGLLLIGFGVGARADILSGWGDADLFAALALGTAALILGVVSKALGERAAARLGDQRALIFKTQLDYQARIYESAMTAGKEAADKALQEAEPEKGEAGFRW